MNVLINRRPDTVQRPLRLLLSPRLIRPIRISIHQNIRRRFLSNMVAIRHSMRTTHRTMALTICKRRNRVRAFVSNGIRHVRSVVFMVKSNRHKERQTRRAIRRSVSVIIRSVSTLRCLLGINNSNTSVIRNLISALLTLNLNSHLLHLKVFTMMLIKSHLASKSHRSQFPIRLQNVRVILSRLRFLRRLVLLRVKIRIIRQRTRLLMRLTLMLILHLSTIIILVLCSFLSRFRNKIILTKVFLAFELSSCLNGLRQNEPRRRIRNIILLPHL